MIKKKKSEEPNESGRHEHPYSHEISSTQREQAANAHDQAEDDMEKDIELTSYDQNDDLDEEESAKLGEDKTDLV